MKLRTLGTGVGFTEGPVFTQEGHILVTSIDHGRMYKFTDKGPEIYAITGGGPNGATEGPDGDIYVTQNGGRWPAIPQPGITGGIQIIHKNRKVEYVTTDPISPNDLCFGPDGLVYITDPSRPRTLNDGRLWRLDIKSLELQLLGSVNWYPNGIGFGKENDFVYVASTNDRKILRFPLSKSGLGKPEVAIEMTSCYPDGFAFDVEGNMIIGAVSLGDNPGEIQVWSSEGKLLDTVRPGNHKFYTNVALSTEKTLVVTDSDGDQVIAYDNWPYAGLLLHPFRKK